MENMSNLLSTSHFNVKVSCADMEDSVLDYFKLNVKSVDFSKSAVKIVCTEDENATCHKIITELYDKSIVPPSISQLTGKVIPPKGNVNISVTLFDKDLKNEVFTDVADGLFLANHKYSVNHDKNDVFVYELMFMHPAAIGGGAMLG